ncbi:MAG TPA: hypothetical protein VMS43_14095 [Allosphingosinicella sp.]|nr:hypothetical protein [Allosphingosinicella sp.]
MGAHANLPKAAYPSQAVIDRTVAAARKAGLDPAGLEVLRDGTIRIVEARAMPQQPASLFDELEAAGKL